MSANTIEATNDIQTLRHLAAEPSTGELAQQREEALADQREALLIRQAQRISELDERILVLTQERDELKARILEQHPQPGTYPAGELRVLVKQGWRGLDGKAFTAAFPPAENPRLYELKPKSLTNVAKLVGELAVERFITRSKPSVVVE